jgi:NAD(P)-dependent dehydrogenase (short-subunit alcohol dehydrogenase family)
MSGRLDGQIAAVTGAASGIGRAIVERFVAEGAHVVAGDIDTDGLATLTDRHPEQVVAMRCDVTVEGDLEAMMAAADDRGGLHIAVANAGKGGFAPIVDQSLDAWREIIDLCLTGVFLTVKHAARHMRDGGSIINIASLNATQPSAGMSAYCAAKAGVVMFTEVAAMELGARQIRVNAIAPGLVETNASAAFWMVPGVVEEFVENTTLGRFAAPADVAGVAAFLASSDASFVSGSCYSVDGGAATKRYPDLPGAFARLAPPAAS